MYWFSEERLSVNLDFLESFLVVPFIKSITYQRGHTVRELSLLDFGTLRHILEYKFWFLKHTMIPCPSLPQVLVVLGTNIFLLADLRRYKFLVTNSTFCEFKLHLSQQTSDLRLWDPKCLLVLVKQQQKKKHDTLSWVYFWRIIHYCFSWAAVFVGASE